MKPFLTGFYPVFRFFSLVKQRVSEGRTALMMTRVHCSWSISHSLLWQCQSVLQSRQTPAQRRNVWLLIMSLESVLWPQPLNGAVWVCDRHPNSFANVPFLFSSHTDWRQTVLLAGVGAQWAANQHISMSSEGSCDTEDWSDDAENTALRHRNKLYFKIYENWLFWIKIILHNITVFTIFFIK